MTPQSTGATSHGFFVTGTDTGVGKTLVACALLRAYAGMGLRAVGMKPVAAGTSVENGSLVSGDAQALRLAGNVAAPGELVNPYCFEPPIAPHIAAAQAGVSIDLERLKNAFLQLAAVSDCVIVEGAGGFRVPLGPHTDTGDLAGVLGLPVVLVVGMRLGCINHALLTAAAVRAEGLTLAGWVANHVDPAFACGDENVAALRERLHAPLLARLAYEQNIDPQRVASGLSVELLQNSSGVKR